MICFEKSYSQEFLFAIRPASHFEVRTRNDNDGNLFLFCRAQNIINHDASGIPITFHLTKVTKTTYVLRMQDQT